VPTPLRHLTVSHGRSPKATPARHLLSIKARTYTPSIPVAISLSRCNFVCM
jgi:hypothetical protein